MVSYNTDELREFGNMWIDTGNQWNDALNAMKGAMGGLEAAWTGEASNAAMAVWDNKVVTMSTQPQSAGNSVAMTFQQAFTVAWEIGDAINNYADQIDQAVKDINKAELESFLAFLFGAILGFLLPELGALLATLFEVIGEAIGMIVSLIAKILSAMGDLGSIAGFALNSVLGAAVALGEDLFAQQLASWAVGLGQIKIDWGAEGVTLGLGGALGGWLGPDWKGSGGAPHGAPEETPAPKVPVGELPKPGDVPQVGTPVPGHGGGAELTPPPAFPGKGSGISVPEGDIAGLGGGLKVDPPAVKPGTGSHSEPIPQAAAPTPHGPLDGTNPVSSGEGTPVPASGAPARPVPEVGGVNGATSPEGVGAGGGPARPAPGVGEGGSPVPGGVGAGGEARPVTGRGEPHTSAPGGVGEGEAVRPATGVTEAPAPVPGGVGGGGRPPTSASGGVGEGAGGPGSPKSDTLAPTTESGAHPEQVPQTTTPTHETVSSHPASSKDSTPPVSSAGPGIRTTGPAAGTKIPDGTGKVPDGHVPAKLWTRNEGPGYARPATIGDLPPGNGTHASESGAAASTKPPTGTGNTLGEAPADPYGHGTSHTAETAPEPVNAPATEGYSGGSHTLGGENTGIRQTIPGAEGTKVPDGTGKVPDGTTPTKLTPGHEGPGYSRPATPSDLPPGNGTHPSESGAAAGTKPPTGTGNTLGEAPGDAFGLGPKHVTEPANVPAAEGYSSGSHTLGGENTGIRQTIPGAEGTKVPDGAHHTTEPANAAAAGPAEKATVTAGGEPAGSAGHPSEATGTSAGQPGTGGTGTGVGKEKAPASAGTGADAPTRPSPTDGKGSSPNPDPTAPTGSAAATPAHDEPGLTHAPTTADQPPARATNPAEGDDAGVQPFAGKGDALGGSGTGVRGAGAADRTEVKLGGETPDGRVPLPLRDGPGYSRPATISDLPAEKTPPPTPGKGADTGPGAPGPGEHSGTPGDGSGDGGFGGSGGGDGSAMGTNQGKGSATYVVYPPERNPLPVKPKTKLAEPESTTVQDTSGAPDTATSHDSLTSESHVASAVADDVAASHISGTETHPQDTGTTTTTQTATEAPTLPTGAKSSTIVSDPTSPTTAPTITAADHADTPSAAAPPAGSDAAHPAVGEPQPAGASHTATNDGSHVLPSPGQVGTPLKGSDGTSVEPTPMAPDPRDAGSPSPLAESPSGISDHGGTQVAGTDITASAGFGDGAVGSSADGGLGTALVASDTFPLDPTAAPGPIATNPSAAATTTAVNPTAAHPAVAGDVPPGTAASAGGELTGPTGIGSGGPGPTGTPAPAQTSEANTPPAHSTPPPATPPVTPPAPVAVNPAAAHSAVAGDVAPVPGAAGQGEQTAPTGSNSEPGPTGTPAPTQTSQANTPPAEATPPPTTMPAPPTAPAAGGIQTTIPEERHASTVSASAVQAERLDLAAAQAALSRPDLTQAERHQALVDAAAILEIRAHALDPLSDPYGLTPLVRPPSGAVGAEAPSAHGRAYQLIAGEIVRHGRLAGRITAEQVLPGSVVGRGPLLLAGATYDSAADALVLGADVVPLDRMSEWLSHNTSWQSGDLVVLPIPGAASPAERLAHEIGAPVLAPGAELAVSAEGGLVSAGGGWVEAGPYGRTTVWQRGLGQSLFARAHAVERGEWEADGGARSGGKARAVDSPSRAIPADGWYVEPAAALSSFTTEAADTGDGATAPAPVGSASIAEPTAPDVDVVSLIRDEYEAAKSGLMTAREALAAAEAALRRGEQPADCDMAVLQTTATKAEALYQQASMNWDLFKQ